MLYFTIQTATPSKSSPLQTPRPTRGRSRGCRLTSHPRRHRDTDQQSLGAEQACHDLAPRLGSAAHEQPVALLLELSRRGLDVVNIELQPSMRDGSVSRPFTGAEA